MKIEDHLKNIRRIQDAAAKQYKLERVLCWLGFHRDWYRSGDGIMHTTECVVCKKITTKLQ